MSDISLIEWTDATWNPIAGCSLKSAGCANCYAMPTARRHELMMAALGRVSSYAGLTRVVNGKAVWTGEMRLVEAALTVPLRWRRPRRIFVNSMSDLFHESVPDAWIDMVFGVMASSPQHTFQVLTKRPDRMRAYLSDLAQGGAEAVRAYLNSPSYRAGCEARAAMPEPRLSDPDPPTPEVRNLYDRAIAAMRDQGIRRHSNRGGVDLPQYHWQRWPLSNVWLGVSAEDQRRADERVPDLLATPAAVRFVSAEPLLGPIDFRTWLSDDDGCERCEGDRCDCPTFKAVFVDDPYDENRPETCWTKRVVLDWIIVGGESGPGARPMHPDWARQIRDACAAAGGAFHFKQWGAWLDERDATARHLAPGPEMFDRFGSPKGPKWHFYDASDRNGGALIRVGKKAAGRLLDGVEHNGFPEARS